MSVSFTVQKYHITASSHMFKWRPQPSSRTNTKPNFAAPAVARLARRAQIFSYIRS